MQIKPDLRRDHLHISSETIETHRSKSLDGGKYRKVTPPKAAERGAEGHLRGILGEPPVALPAPRVQCNVQRRTKVDDGESNVEEGLERTDARADRCASGELVGLLGGALDEEIHLIRLLQLG